MSWDVLRLVNLILVCLGTLKEYRTCHGNPRHLCNICEVHGECFDESWASNASSDLTQPDRYLQPSVDLLQSEKLWWIILIINHVLGIIVHAELIRVCTHI